VDNGGEFDRRDNHLGNSSHGPDCLGERHEDGGLAPFVNEEFVGVDTTGRSGRVEVLRTDSGFQLAERALVPDEYVRPAAQSQ
jgi:hypothetical protein